MNSSYTPLRYPGGKTKLFPIISEIITTNKPPNSTYVEPFAGGAGLALKLLFKGYVNKIVINDFDYAVYCIWDTILNHTESMCDFIETVQLTVTEWQRQREIYNNQSNYNSVDISKASFFLNRTNVSGILKGGVIGGISQEGNYKIDARFNKKALIQLIKNISNLKDKIDLYSWDAKDFITQIIPKYSGCFVYFDPPYVKKGHSLYRNSYNENDHRSIQQVISTCPEKWIVTYDDCELIREIYSGYSYDTLSINYSVGKTKKGAEIIIYGPTITKKV